MEKEMIEGEVREIVYYNDDNCYCVFDLDFGRNLITCVGNIPFLSAGERVRLEGVWTSHPDYGEQFKFDNFIRTIPQKVNAIRTYLASGVIPGIREATAVKITDVFGEEALEVKRARKAHCHKGHIPCQGYENERSLSHSSGCGKHGNVSAAIRRNCKNGSKNTQKIRFTCSGPYQGQPLHSLR